VQDASPRIGWQIEPGRVDLGQVLSITGPPGA